MTIVEALQNLYVAMGGSAEDVANIALNPDMINELATLVSSGATKELPAVTAEDNDKVLAVVNGAWDKAEASGSGGAQYHFINDTLRNTQNADIPAGETGYWEYTKANSNLPDSTKGMNIRLTNANMDNNGDFAVLSYSVGVYDGRLEIGMWIKNFSSTKAFTKSSAGFFLDAISF